jgi:hypothetical protein
MGCLRFMRRGDKVFKVRSLQIARPLMNFLGWFLLVYRKLAQFALVLVEAVGQRKQIKAAAAEAAEL